MSNEYETAEEMIEEWEQNVTAIARALGVEGKLAGDATGEDVKRFKAALSGQSARHAEKAGAEDSDDDLEESVEQIRRALHLVAHELDVPERELKGEYDPESESTKNFKAALGGGS